MQITAQDCTLLRLALALKVDLMRVDIKNSRDKVYQRIDQLMFEFDIAGTTKEGYDLSRKMDLFICLMSIEKLIYLLEDQSDRRLLGMIGIFFEMDSLSVESIRGLQAEIHHEYKASGSLHRAANFLKHTVLRSGPSDHDNSPHQ